MNKGIKLSLYLSLFVMLGVTFYVIRPDMTEAEKAAIPIIEKNVQARGGLNAWRAIDSMTMSGQMDAGKKRPVEAIIRTALERRPANIRSLNPAADLQKTADQGDRVIRLPYQLELQRPRKMRLELNFQGQTAIQVYNGSQGWKLRPFLGRHEVENYTAEELKLAAAQQDLDGPLIDYSKKGSRIELEGSDPVEGNEAYRLKVTLKDGQIRHVWVDKNTYLDIKIDGSKRMDGKIRPVSTFLRDYQSVDGVQIPHTLITSVEGVPGAETIRVDTVVLNTHIDDSRFSKPD